MTGARFPREKETQARDGKKRVNQGNGKKNPKAGFKVFGDGWFVFKIPHCRGRSLPGGLRF